MKLIQFTKRGNKIKIPGTNEMLDWLINLLPLPFLGFHIGALLASIGPLYRIIPKLEKGQLVEIEGHSLGGAVAQIIAIYLLLFGYKVKIETQGAFSSASWFWSILFTLLGGEARIRICGNDPVPRFWPWFCFLALPEYEGNKRKWYIVNFKDHVRY